MKSCCLSGGSQRSQRRIPANTPQRPQGHQRCAPLGKFNLFFQPLPNKGSLYRLRSWAQICSSSLDQKVKAFPPASEAHDIRLRLFRCHTPAASRLAFPSSDALSPRKRIEVSKIRAATIQDPFKIKRRKSCSLIYCDLYRVPLPV